MKIGYEKIDKDSQVENQDDLMKRIGAEKMFIDVYNEENYRPELKAMLKYIREGDIVIVESISKLAKNIRDFLDILGKITEKGVDFISQKEAMDTRTPEGKKVLNVFGAINNFEKDYIVEKKLKGKYRGRTPIKVDEKKFSEQYNLWRSGKITAVCAMSNLS